MPGEGEDKACPCLGLFERGKCDGGKSQPSAVPRWHHSRLKSGGSRRSTAPISIFSLSWHPHIMTRFHPFHVHSDGQQRHGIRGPPALSRRCTGVGWDEPGSKRCSCTLSLTRSHSRISRKSVRCPVLPRCAAPSCLHLNVPHFRFILSARHPVYVPAKPPRQTNAAVDPGRRCRLRVQKLHSRILHRCTCLCLGLRLAIARAVPSNSREAHLQLML